MKKVGFWLVLLLVVVVLGGMSKSSGLIDMPWQCIVNGDFDDDGSSWYSPEGYEPFNYSATWDAMENSHDTTSLSTEDCFTMGQLVDLTDLDEYDYTCVINYYFHFSPVDCELFDLITLPFSAQGLVLTQEVLKNMEPASLGPVDESSDVFSSVAPFNGLLSPVYNIHFEGEVVNPEDGTYPFIIAVDFDLDQEPGSSRQTSSSFFAVDAVSVTWDYLTEPADSEERGPKVVITNLTTGRSRVIEGEELESLVSSKIKMPTEHNGIPLKFLSVDAWTKGIKR